MSRSAPQVNNVSNQWLKAYVPQKSDGRTLLAVSPFLAILSAPTTLFRGKTYDTREDDEQRLAYRRHVYYGVGTETQPLYHISSWREF